MTSPECRQPPPVRRTIPWPKHSSEISRGIVPVREGRLMSAPRPLPWKPHDSSHFLMLKHLIFTSPLISIEPCSILDSLNSNMAEFILRKCVISLSFIKLKMQNFERYAIIPVKLVFDAVFPSFLHFLTSCSYDRIIFHVILNFILLTWIPLRKHGLV